MLQTACSRPLLQEVEFGLGVRRHVLTLAPNIPRGVKVPQAPPRSGHAEGMPPAWSAPPGGRFCNVSTH